MSQSMGGGMGGMPFGEWGGKEGGRDVYSKFACLILLITSLIPPSLPPSGMGMGGGFVPGASPPRGPPKKAEPVEYNFNVTLEDLYTGGLNKKMRITKKVSPPSLPPSLLVSLIECVSRTPRIAARRIKPISSLPPSLPLSLDLGRSLRSLSPHDRRQGNLHQERVEERDQNHLRTGGRRAPRRHSRRYCLCAQHEAPPTLREGGG